MQHPADTVHWPTVTYLHGDPSLPPGVPAGTYTLLPSHPFRPGMTPAVVNRLPSNGKLMQRQEDRTPEAWVLSNCFWTDDMAFWDLVTMHAPRLLAEWAAE
ncbi:hypothetical protein [Medusavirus stheno T3]|uniref:Uncharacterized protein n=1 Tax=Medusavirus stheno T3 TaxID=3069717 RepID=A0A7S7YF05_9VIRU|nr:hypothetical protein QKU73_gp179 [Acanthamoeba castellanii medusavirus]QPB44596.1 hypothetical protein [Medusavirus stheno T3]